MSYFEKMLCRIPTSLQIKGNILSPSDICEMYVLNKSRPLKRNILIYLDKNPFLMQKKLLSEDIMALD